MLPTRRYMSDAHAPGLWSFLRICPVSSGIDRSIRTLWSYNFIEMNPRCQVDHTVTEFVTGVDIMQAQ